MSPAAAAILDYIEPVDESPLGLQLATSADLEREQIRHDRRAHRRHRDEDLRWIKRARLNGHAVSIVDLSASGVLLDAPIPLRPDSLLTLQIDGRNFDKSIPFRVVRCQIGALLPERPVYRGACEFTTLIELPSECIGGARLLTHPAAFVTLDLALKQLVERTGPTGTLGVLDAKSVKQSLESLRDKALNSPLDPIAQPLAGLLDRVVPMLDRYRGLADLLPWIESQLRRTVPPVSLRLVDAGTPARTDVKSVLIQVPGARATRSSWVSVDLPRGFVLSDWQSRVLRVASRLIALLQRIDPGDAPSVPVATQPGKEKPAVASKVPAEAEASLQNSGWQKIVVRYTEGQILKGYTQDFNPARSQFSLWPSLTATARERVIVPLARLKGVFFVRDFAGNPGYVDRVDSDQPQHGRRIAVTLLDDEVISGRTLNYRADGSGFFVVPADPLNNNIRVFIVATAVREVRFP